MPARIEPMTEAEYKIYLQHLIPDYAKDNIEAGHWDESEAIEKSKQSIDSLLPQGLGTKDHLIYTVWDGDQPVGRTWLHVRLDAPTKSGFIFDIEMDADQRGKGYGRQTMLLLEEKARELGIQKMELHVFAKNAVAKSLYESLGYQTSSTNMVKRLNA
jgi:ribosomal protein S18 acetylase RimI-like enzyme